MSTPSPQGTVHPSVPTRSGGISKLPPEVGWDPSPSEPITFGRYRLIERLGKGGMGSVYLAQDTKLGRKVVVKIPNTPAASASPDELERFYREGEAAAQLAHSNLCPVYDVGEHQGTPYLVMAYIEGKSLNEILAEKIERKKLPKRERTVEIVLQVALAMQKAHEHGVIHRDLKPANVMIRNDDHQPVVVDFGLALRRLGTQVPRLTKSNEWIGTPAYMSPEQFKGDPNIGPASDIYSLGVMLYEMLTSRLPFDGRPLGLMVCIADEEPPPPSRFRQGLPAKLDAVCMQALAEKPEQRFASMAKFAEALEEVLKEFSTAPSEVPTLPAPGREPLPQPREVSQMDGPVVQPPPWGVAVWLIVPVVFLVALGAGVVAYSKFVSAVPANQEQGQANRRQDQDKVGERLPTKQPEKEEKRGEKGGGGAKKPKLKTYSDSVGLGSFTKAKDFWNEHHLGRASKDVEEDRNRLTRAAKEYKDAAARISEDLQDDGFETIRTHLKQHLGYSHKGYATALHQLHQYDEAVDQFIIATEILSDVIDKSNNADPINRYWESLDGAKLALVESARIKTARIHHFEKTKLGVVKK